MPVGSLVLAIALSFQVTPLVGGLVLSKAPLERLLASGSCKITYRLLVTVVEDLADVADGCATCPQLGNDATARALDSVVPFGSSSLSLGPDLPRLVSQLVR